MDPKNAIAPTLIIRRQGKKKWHMYRTHAFLEYMTMCRQSIRYPEERTAYNAHEITCNECLVAAISEGRPQP